MLTYEDLLSLAGICVMASIIGAVFVAFYIKSELVDLKRDFSDQVLLMKKEGNSLVSSFNRAVNNAEGKINSIIPNLTASGEWTQILAGLAKGFIDSKTGRKMLAGEEVAVQEAEPPPGPDNYSTDELREYKKFYKDNLAVINQELKKRK